MGIGVRDGFCVAVGDDVAVMVGVNVEVAVTVGVHDGGRARRPFEVVVATVGLTRGLSVTVSALVTTSVGNCTRVGKTATSPVRFTPQAVKISSVIVKTPSAFKYRFHHKNLLLLTVHRTGHTSDNQ